ncbi:MAG: iron-containing alcohol dehydrogenase family protein [Clostridiales bacterium]|nr:iron-containing alcohol dehydrogenase family protein [Clostridiales bacterium]
MTDYSMFMPGYSIGGRVYEKIPQICAPYGKTAVVIGGKKAMAAAKSALEAGIDGTDIKITAYKWFGGECSYENVDKNAADEDIRAADMIFAVGGGKATDTAKCVGERLNKPVFSFPTIASNCACCTSVSIMYDSESVFLEPHFFERPPVHAFVNTQIIAQSPSKYLWAGMGDTYAKHFEAYVSSRGEETEHFIALGVEASGMCVKPILRWGKKALEDNRQKRNSYELEQVILAICITTGIVSVLLTRDHTPDYNSGIAHAVFYALTSFEEIEKNHLHGEVVAFGVLMLLLCDKDYEAFERIYSFNKSVGLPVSVEDIGISADEFRGLFDTIPNMSDVRHYPYKISAEMLNEALDYLNKFNEGKVCL